MPPAAIVDLRELDLDHVEFGPEEIRRCNPHRHEMELLDAILAYWPERKLIVGVRSVERDEFWVRGHIPDRPLFPGVLMVEAAAQLCSFYWHQAFPSVDDFFGFSGIEETRFRGTVVPGDRLIIAGRTVQVKPRRAIFEAQGFVDEKMVFETRIHGMLISR